jgi:hypothetical protein
MVVLAARAWQWRRGRGGGRTRQVPRDEASEGASWAARRAGPRALPMGETRWSGEGGLGDGGCRHATMRQRIPLSRASYPSARTTTWTARSCRPAGRQASRQAGRRAGKDVSIGTARTAR